MITHFNKYSLEDMFMKGYSGSSFIGQPVRPTYTETPHLTYTEGIYGVYGETTGNTPLDAWEKYQKIKVEAITYKTSENKPTKKKKSKQQEEHRTTSPYEPSFDPSVLSTFLGMGLL